MKIYSVIVCYRPDTDCLLRLCENLLADNSSVILVDNSEVPVLENEELPKDCQLLTLGFNSGIARAQNIGVEAAIAGGADVVAFFDQDSIFGPDLMGALACELELNTAKIVSPLYLDDTNNSELPSQRVSARGVTTAVHRGGSIEAYPVDVVISSGTVATKEVFEIAGPFDEDLFIDFVDTEWCLRCRSKDIPIYVVPSALMRHRIGSKSIRFSRLTILLHPPLRCYYQVRNSLHLFRYRHVPFVFAAKQAISVLGSRIILLFFVGRKLAHMKAILLGLLDGMIGHKGKKST